MAKKSSALSVMRRATSAMVANPLTVLLIAFPMGLVSAFTSLGLLDHFGSMSQGDDAMVPLLIYDAGIRLSMEVLLGPIIAAMSIYVARAWSKGEEGSFSRALNFALNRYGRMIKWHAIGWLCIHFGLALICVPGILFLGMYAFVDPVLCLEKEAWPLARSKELTRGRRRTIFLTALPWLLLSQIVPMLEYFGMVPQLVQRLGLVPQKMSASGVPVTDLRALELSTEVGFVVLDTMIYLLIIWTFMCFTMIYEDRTTPVSKPTAS